jgi:hypothetical protein
VEEPLVAPKAIPSDPEEAWNWYKEKKSYETMLKSAITRNTVITYLLSILFYFNIVYCLF